MSDTGQPNRPSIFPRIMAVILGAIGLFMSTGGAYLLTFGGSPYYLVAGVGLILTAFMLWRRLAAALLVFALVLAGTLIWALAEVGLDFWQLAPRGDLLVPIGVILVLPWLTRSLEPRASALRG